MRELLTVMIELVLLTLSKFFKTDSHSLALTLMYNNLSFDICKYNKKAKQKILFFLCVYPKKVH